MPKFFTRKKVEEIKPICEDENRLLENMYKRFDAMQQEQEKFKQFTQNVTQAYAPIPQAQTKTISSVDQYTFNPPFDERTGFPTKKLRRISPAGVDKPGETVLT